ncbi:MAG: DUF4934 domain-containing protein [Tannerella sp.]|jgi:hypothetical protein|nr:DUF4934 domain-containing protein [Tannerella sp.]
MKYPAIIALFGIVLLISCNNQGNKTVDRSVINIEQGLQGLTRLKTSDFGKNIRFIPLETPDNGLIGRTPIINVLNNYIVVESQRTCLLFDKKEGSFIAEIGHFGQGPQEYTDAFSWTDEKEEFLYFRRAPNTLLKFDMQGNFGGQIQFTPLGLASYYEWDDTGIIGYFDGMNMSGQNMLGFYDKDGLLKDSIPHFSPTSQIATDQIAGISVFRDTLYGIWSRTGVINIDFKNDDKQLITQNAAKMWRYNGNVRFKEDFVDTIYTVSDNKLTPYMTFQTGQYHWPIEDALSSKNTDERVFIAAVTENDDHVFFQCIKGLYTDHQVLYNGLFDKKTGEIKLSDNNEEIEDDLTGFIPFKPLGVSTTGEFVSLVESWKVMEWLEKHPEAQSNENLSFLRGMNAEMNPVVILIE